MELQSESHDPRLGKTYGSCKIENRVADGAMGRVYAARRSDGTKVALKVLHDNVARDHVSVERFKREFETARDLDSPYVVRVYEYGETGDGSYYLAMEFLEGEELGALLRRESRVAKARLVRIIAQICLGLEDAHSFGVIHRDLKPDNLFLCKTANGDDVRILDFGSVKLQMETGPKLTAFGTTLGSPYYMSPEQAMGKANVDNRTDLFALGAIIYEALAGKTPYEGASVAQILMKIVNEVPAPIASLDATLPDAFSEALEASMAKDKEHRQRSGVELAGSLLRALGLFTGSATREQIEGWAKMSVGEIESALATARPPAVSQAASAPPAKKSAAPVASAVKALESSPPSAPARSRTPMLIAVGVALLVLGVVGSMLMR